LGSYAPKECGDGAPQGGAVSCLRGEGRNDSEAEWRRSLASVKLQAEGLRRGASRRRAPYGSCGRRWATSERLI